MWTVGINERCQLLNYLNANAGDIGGASSGEVSPVNNSLFTDTVLVGLTAGTFSSSAVAVSLDIPSAKAERKLRH